MKKDEKERTDNNRTVAGKGKKITIMVTKMIDTTIDTKKNEEKDSRKGE